MKTASTLLFAGAAAAHYGYEHHAESKSKVGYTTIYPGHGYEPVTVTKQYQPIPTYVEPKGEYETTGSWSKYPWVSTVIEDYDHNKVTVTKYDQDVTVYHTKATYTHTSTEEPYAAPSGYYPTGYPSKNNTKTWYELYEKVHEVPYKDLGPHAIPGYHGSDLYEGHKDKQPVKVKEYKDGKWSHYDYVVDYSKPKSHHYSEHKPTYAPAEVTKTAKAGETVTYGGVTADVTCATTLTVPYGAYETHGSKTKTVVHYTTVTYTKPGHYTVVKPKTTVYDHDTTYKVPTCTKKPVKETSKHPSYPTDAYPTDAYPTDAYPTKAYPTDAYPTDAYPTDAYPTDVYPTDYPTATYPTDSYPTDTYPEPSTTTPYGPDPSSDYEEPAEPYGTPSAGYVKRGGMLERRKAIPEVKYAAGSRVILV